jgi:hypothetical protein
MVLPPVCCSVWCRSTIAVVFGGTADDGEAGTSGGKAALAVAFACDGTLIATGCSERLMTVTDAARPQLGPLAQFLAYGDVTAIAMGPGVLPWDDSGYAVDEDRTSAENKSTITFKRFRDEPLPRCGDGFGHIGAFRFLGALPCVAHSVC